METVAVLVDGETLSANYVGQIALRARALGTVAADMLARTQIIYIPGPNGTDQSDRLQALNACISTSSPA